MPTRVQISEVLVDELGALHIKPAESDPGFQYVYRAAMQVYWNPSAGTFFSPPPQEWSYLQWFQQIVGAVADELGVELVLSPETEWRNVPAMVRAELENP